MDAILTQLNKQMKNFTLLFVEDDEESRVQLTQLFSIFFKEITTAIDGQDGWKKYQDGTYDVVVTDINMPRMNGIKLSEKIKKHNSEQKIIIISAYDTSEYLVPAIQLGVDGFIMKPVEREQMMDVFQKIGFAIQTEMIAKNYYKALESEVKNKTLELQTLAVTDELTGLFNRTKFNQALREEDEKLLYLVNIDNFDNINISYGYHNGDIILKKIAQFFQQNIPPFALLFRLGHDEFAIISPRSDLTETQAYAQQLKEKIAACPIEHEGITIRFTATIAIAQGASDLLKNAHIALKETRQLGRNRIHAYQNNSSFEAYQKEIQRHIPILFDAINGDNIVPYYQPIINNTTQRIEKYEALARIILENEVIRPDYFIKAAELSGMLPIITRIMIEKSFYYFKDQPYEFSINIGEQDLNESYLVEFLTKTTQKYQINPNRVVIEVLEGISAFATEQNLNQLNEIKSLGFQLAIDDFGTQNSNFERVHRLDVDYIKIDGSFIKNMDSDINSYKIAQNITSFAKSMGAKVIAEFVHNESIYNKVMELGIDYTQGYYTGEPKRTCKEEDQS